MDAAGQRTYDEGLVSGPRLLVLMSHRAHDVAHAREHARTLLPLTNGVSVENLELK